MDTSDRPTHTPIYGFNAEKASIKKSASMIERLMARVNKKGPLHPTESDKGFCWISSHRKVGNGYPQIMGPRADGTKARQYTHRVMWEYLNGPIPQGLVVMHTCDNRACCNPAHLKLGTQADNVHDMVTKGRSRYAKPLSFAELALIQKLRSTGDTIARIAKQSGRSLNTVRNAIRQTPVSYQSDLFGPPPLTA